MTLSLMALQLSTEMADQREAASIVSIFIVLLTVGLAVPLRSFCLRLGVRHTVQSSDAARQSKPVAAATARPAMAR